MKNKVIIDARIITPELTGIGRYTYELIKQCSKRGIEFVLLINDEEIIKQLFMDIKDFEIIKMRSKFLEIREQVELPRILNRFKGQNVVFHSPSFVSSPFINIPMIMTIHDLNHIRFPQFYSSFHKYYYNYIVKPSAKKSEKIITVSNFSKEELIEWLGCDDNKVDVTYNGVDEKYKKILDPDLKNNVSSKYNLPEKFVLYIGNQKPHKNIKTLVKALKNIPKEYSLVINGKENGELSQLSKNLGVEDRIKFIGFVEENDLPIIYNLCTVFVYPSLYEGFGLPVLEAMACECPVLAANTSSLIEVCNSEEILFECDNENDLAMKINRIILDDEARILNIEHGKVQSKKFNWEDTAIKTIKIYNDIFKF